MKLHRISFPLIFCLLAQPVAAQGVWDSFKQGSRQTFMGSRIWIWGTGAALTGVAFAYDRDVYRHHIARDDWQPANFVGDNLGTGVPGAVLALGSLALGRKLGKERLFRAGWGHAEALVGAFLLTTVMKGAVARPRPEAYTGHESAFNSSFPSGHTSTAFATAGSLWSFYGPTVGIPMMVLAVMAGYSRIQHGVHYLSDVIFGATVGIGTGFAFAQTHLRDGADPGAQAFQWVPFFSPRSGGGLAVNGSF